MAEKLKDAEDLKLQSLFATVAVDDDGFSRKVMSRIRRQIWVRRLSMPVGIAVGTLIGAKPLLQVASVIPELLQSMAGGVLSLNRLPIDHLPQASTIFLGAALLLAAIMVGKILEE